MVATDSKIKKINKKETISAHFACVPLIQCITVCVVHVVVLVTRDKSGGRCGGGGGRMVVAVVVKALCSTRKLSKIKKKITTVCVVNFVQVWSWWVAGRARGS